MTGNTRLFHEAVKARVSWVVAVDPNEFKVISHSVKKTDSNDARNLALYLAKDLLPEVRMKDDGSNRRNGANHKKLTGEFGKVEIAVPRDREGSFEPKIVAKHQTRWTGFDDKVLSMYARGMASEHLGHEAILQSDLLGADALLVQTQNAIRDAEDKLASAGEKLDDLMGRDIHTRFRVSAISQGRGDLETPATLEARGLKNRPEQKKEKLPVQQADYDARAKKAEYIPDVSAAVTYFTTPNFANELPSTAGLQLTWEPWDWGRKRQE